MESLYGKQIAIFLPRKEEGENHLVDILILLGIMLRAVFIKLFQKKNVIPHTFYPGKFQLVLIFGWNSFLWDNIHTKNLCIKWAGLEF